MRKIPILLTLSLCALFTYSQNTLIPDSMFEQALIDLGYDTIIDGSVPTVNIDSIVELNVENKSISSLEGIEDFTLLRRLYCKENSILNLPINNNIALRTLSCSNNLITSLNLNNLVNLKNLFCNSNKLINLDVSNNSELKNLQCKDNSISNLILDNNIKLAKLIATNNFISNLNLNNLSSLKILNINNNLVNIIDLSNNINLTKLFINNNGLDTIDLTNNIALKRLYINENNLSSLNLSSNTSLIFLYCHTNNLISIDVTNNLLLKRLYAQNNSLTNINLTGLNQLSRLYLNSNNLNTLDVSTNTALSWLYFNYNSITNIDLSNNISLTRLYCRNNSLTSLDLNINISLEKLLCKNNLLNSLNIKNGQNTNLTLFNAKNNSSLTCIEVDDPVYSTTNWTLKDNIASFKHNCGLLLNISVFLQGAAINPNLNEEHLMRDDLRVANIIPLTSTFTDAVTCLPSLFNASGNDAIVDWVSIELRDPIDNSIILSQQSGFLQRDGDVVAVDGVSPISFDLESGNYLVAIIHRNHLNIISANPISLSTNPTYLDFSSTTTSVLGGSNALALLANGFFGMYAGDTDKNGQILNTDVIATIVISGTSGYISSDANLDGQILNTDVQNLIQPNSGKGEQF